ncbi:MAG: tRNA uridine-5-carboxymethylaminomethyl(34) synthesis GTPase MnmE [Bacteroidota bacterium]|nr:tRNA uridine-5-carboxymethylaminomethyl(34) synthesis GTPase MnmE [Bacteroidota bacterium]
MRPNETIVALSTASGVGALSVIRLSGTKAFDIIDALLKKPVGNKPTHTVCLRGIYDEQGLIDETVITIFHEGKSYTKENVVEISLHGSEYIAQRTLLALMKAGAVMAEPGEFTQRAFLHGTLDLAQAEAVADLIAAEHKFAHENALKQLRGGFSDDIKSLRERLLHFTSLIELELDFGEEDVEFASRSELKDLVIDIKQKVDELRDSFTLGNALKKGFALVLAGRPNAGKSTLFNALINDEKAIVSDIAGTTRDAIDERIAIGDVWVRLIDTAGIRDATDAIEREGINRTFKHIESSGATLYLFDPSLMSVEEVLNDLSEISEKSERIWVIANKLDYFKDDLSIYDPVFEKYGGLSLKGISALDVSEVSELRSQLATKFTEDVRRISDQTIVTNARHSHSLNACSNELQQILYGMEMGLSGDLLSFHLRTGIKELASITGEIDNEEVLGKIFSSFCIGK